LISHAHIDHFVGLDALLRVSVGREKTIKLVGPAGIVERVWHKLQAYTWDIVDRYATDLVFDVTEVGPATLKRARLRFKTRFAVEDAGETARAGSAVLEGPNFSVSAAILEHHGPCLGFAIEETAHANVWKNRLETLGLDTSAWLQALKRAVLEGRSDDHPVDVPGRGRMALAQLRDVVPLSREQKIAYVTDVSDTQANRAAIVELAAGADLLFIEARFRGDDAEQAARRAHLTTVAAGEIARAAGVRRVEPFHFSPRYEASESAMLGEVEAAFGA